MAPTPPLLFSDAELDEFQSLAKQHAGVSLAREQASAVAYQLLRVLWVIRAVAKSSSHSTTSVDEPDLAKNAILDNR